MHDPAHNELAGEAKRQFSAHYGRPPKWIAVAPGRVNLIGEHVDYNDGLVLPMAIERHTVVAADVRRETVRRETARRDAGTDTPLGLRVYSESIGAECQVDLRAEEFQPEWMAYVAGTVRECQDVGLVLDQPLDLWIHSTVPLGGGLSSSAALEVAVATLMEQVCGRPLPPLDKALLCQRAEHRYAHVPCGIMDQAIVSCARQHHLMLLDCRSLQYRMIELRHPSPAILIINTHVHHALADSQYAQRRAECQAACAALQVESLRDVTLDRLSAELGKLDRLLYRRAHHVVTEIERTAATAAALQRGDWAAAGAAMNASHASLRDDYEVSCRELDVLVELAQQAGLAHGVYGARMTGGGFGGCAVMLVDAACVERASQRLCAEYERATGITPSAIVTAPAGGASHA